MFLQNKHLCYIVFLYFEIAVVGNRCTYSLEILELFSKKKMMSVSQVRFQRRSKLIITQLIKWRHEIRKKSVAMVCERQDTNVKSGQTYNQAYLAKHRIQLTSLMKWKERILVNDP